MSVAIHEISVTFDGLDEQKKLGCFPFQWATFFFCKTCCPAIIREEIWKM